jgi:hypothetical protein
MANNFLKSFSYLIFLLCIFVIPYVVFGADLYITPSNTTVSVGDILTLKVMVSNSDASLNAISGDVIFPSIFTIESVLKTNSVLNFWVTEPSFSNISGGVHFEGVSLTGFRGSEGTVVTAVLRATKEGAGNVSFKSGQILANDGQGTDITKGLSGGSYNVIPAKIPDKNIEIEPKKDDKKILEKTDGLQNVEEPQAPPTLNPPEIIISKKYGENAILGTGEYPGVQVLVTFVAMDGSKLFITGKSDKDGEFTVLIPKALKRGEYSVTAIMVKEDGTSSPQSEKLKIIIGNIFSDLGIGFYVTLGLLIMVIIYLLYKLSSRHKKGLPLVVLREIKEAEVVVKKSFDILRDDIKDLGKKSRLRDTKNGVLGESVDLIKSDLDDAESVIKKEIEDIDSV